MSDSHGHRPAPPVDTSEYGAEQGGERQAMDRRLFMQLLAFRCAPARPVAEVTDALTSSLEERKVAGVVYADVNDPRGLGLVTWAEDPAHFVEVVRPAANALGADLSPRPEMTMLGRTYSSGYESDLAHWLLRRAPETLTKPEWPWAIWYPLRRSGAFAQLEAGEQGAILREHAVIGRAYGDEDLVHDVRLACHGLDTNDNEFVIGLAGKALHPLSHVIQTMRRTRQTAEYISQMGPFFVGHAIWQRLGQ